MDRKVYVKDKDQRSIEKCFKSNPPRPSTPVPRATVPRATVIDVLEGGTSTRNFPKFNMDGGSLRCFTEWLVTVDGGKKKIREHSPYV